MVGGSARNSESGRGSNERVLPDLARSVELLSVDPDGTESTDRRDGLRELARLSARVDACMSRFVGSIDTHSDHVLDGARSASSWMAGATGVDKRRCGRLLGADRDLRHLDLIREAWQAGTLNTDKVNALLAVRDGVEAQLQRDQAELIAQIAHVTADRARRLLHRWRESALAELDRSPDDPEPDDPKLNELRITETFGGTHLLDGAFSGLVGKELASLIAGLGGRFRVAGEVTTARHANASQRRQLRVRDQGCAWPACEAPASWCQAHHEPPWEDAHRTTTSEMVLLCRHHHRLRHEHGYTFVVDTDGDLTVIRPDGTPVPTTPPGGLVGISEETEPPGPEPSADERHRPNSDLGRCRHGENERIDHQMHQATRRRLRALLAEPPPVG